MEFVDKGIFSEIDGLFQMTEELGFSPGFILVYSEAPLNEVLKKKK